MANFSMTAAKGSSNNSHSVDWNAFNEHLFSVIGDKTRSLQYVVCGLVELGTQELENFEIPLAEASADQKKVLDDKERGAQVIIAPHPKTKEPVETLSIPQKPKPQLAIVLEIPSLKVDYGKFFNADGASEERPYRVYFGGDWMVQDGEKKVKILARPCNVVCQPNDKAKSGWAYAPNNAIYKFAEAGGVLEGAALDQGFDLGSLLGTQGLIKVVASRTDKGDKVFVNVKVKDPAPAPEAVPPVDLEKEGISLWGVMINSEENDPEVVKKLSAACKNSIKRASEYEGSAIQKLLEGATEGSPSEGEQPPSSEDKTPSNASQEASCPFEEDDLDQLESTGDVETPAESSEDEDFDPFA